MKQGLSLRVSQHLALTPQLQQSIRLLQLSTLELSQEIDQMLDDNPFLEKELEDLAPREDFGLEQENTQAASSDAEPESWDGPMDRVSEVRVETASETTALWMLRALLKAGTAMAAWNFHLTTASGAAMHLRATTAAMTMMKKRKPLSWRETKNHSPRSCIDKLCRCDLTTPTVLPCVFSLNP